MSGHVLRPEHHARAWELSYRRSLDALPDAEITWERDVWRMQSATALAAMADGLLAERRADGFALPGGADAADLGTLLCRVNVVAAMRLVREEALPLVEALHLLYWTGLRESER